MLRHRPSQRSRAYFRALWSRLPSSNVTLRSITPGTMYPCCEAIFSKTPIFDVHNKIVDEVDCWRLKFSWAVRLPGDMGGDFMLMWIQYQLFSDGEMETVGLHPRTKETEHTFESLKNLKAKKWFTLVDPADFEEYSGNIPLHCLPPPMSGYACFVPP